MLWSVLRAMARVALRWYYREIVVDGLERVPASAPVLLVANHPNALVDVLLLGTAMRRPLVLTAKATLFAHPLLRWVMRRLDVVPLRRAADESAAGAAAAPDVRRNVRAFDDIVAALAARRVVLIFPEGRSHHEPSLAPIRTGAARIALQARESGVHALEIVPVGIVFERKWEPRTRVLVRYGEPIALDRWPAPAGDAVQALTDEIDVRLRALTLNFESVDAERQVAALARAIAPLLRAPPGPGRPVEVPFALETTVARRLEALRRDGRADDEVLAARVEAFLARVAAFRGTLRETGVHVADLGISTHWHPTLGLVVREGARLVLLAPLALWGWLNHWLPLHLARTVAARESQGPEDPAMYTIAVGTGLVLVFYVLQTAIVWRLTTTWWALAYLVSLPPTETLDFRLRDRVRWVRRRVRSWRRLRRDPGLARRLTSELAALRGEAYALDAALATAGAGAGA